MTILAGIVVIIETTIFTKQVHKLLTDDEYHLLQQERLKRPDVGVIIRGSGGLRKVRWGAQGRGKRGGSRVIYYWAVNQDQILMLLIYPKNVQDDLSPEQVRVLRNIVEAEYP
ncbi:MAG: hypothetical protein KDE54_18165 [Caldilineaceae bacterium]|nr:hypothetical protein [Caldilineaceae bacterium]MCB0143969.1 hypothetical protein [Caldilineaceae bacterium]